jgi:hypothetical protein
MSVASARQSLVAVWSQAEPGTKNHGSSFRLQAGVMRTEDPPRRSIFFCAVAALAVTLGPFPAPEAGGQAANGVTVHEWGVLSVYNDIELANADMRAEWDGLPKFVHGRVDGRTVPVYNGPVRAPVLYFHAQQPIGLNVKVDFPKGKPAVWWPGNAIGGRGGIQAQAVQPESSLTWNFQLRPSNAANYKLKELPKGHWMEALRNVKAEDVHFSQTDFLAPPGAGLTKERFIYYDGLIPSPKGLTIQVQGDTISLKSQAKHPLLDVTVVDLRNIRKIRTATIAKMEPEADVKEVKLAERDQTKWPSAGIDELITQLKAAGLNEDEARSLTDVWRKAFFETEGVSVFYRLPQDIYDQLLPLTVNPKPEKVVRTLLVHHPHCEPDLADRVLALVKDLGSVKFEERIEAQKRLQALGKAAFVHLLRARDAAKDPEVKSRLTKVLEEFEAEKGFNK